MGAVVTVERRRPGRGRGRNGIAVGLVVVAGALLVMMTWSMLRVVWFVEAGGHCRQQDCTVAALEASATSGQAPADDPMIEGQGALWDAGVTPLEHTFAYVPMVGIAFGLVLVLGLAATGLRWSSTGRRTPEGVVRPTLAEFVRSDPVVRALAVSAATFLVLYLLAWDQMAWFAWVTD